MFAEEKELELDAARNFLPPTIAQEKFIDELYRAAESHNAKILSIKAGEIISAEKIQDILIQVNLAKEDSKSGVYKENLKNLIEKVDELKNLRLLGLMMIAPNYSDVEKCRPLFAEMRKIFDEIKVNLQNFQNIFYLHP